MLKIKGDIMPAAKVKEPSSKFVKVRCAKCKNEQIVFGKASTAIKCLVCEKFITEPTGGKAKFKARVLEVMH
jgi:small subunit ribosomal protein S27e